MSYSMLAKHKTNTTSTTKMSLKTLCLLCTPKKHAAHENYFVTPETNFIIISYIWTCSYGQDKGITTIHLKVHTTSCSGISIGFPVRNDVKTPRLVTGAEGSGPVSCCPLSSCSSDRLPIMIII